MSAIHTHPIIDGPFSGQLLAPGDAEYDEARIPWNADIDRRPVLIARCEDNDDVVGAIAAARAAGLPLAVRGGGHSASGHSVAEGGVVIDLSRMKRVAIDADRRIVRAGAGLLLGELDAETQRFGLAVPAGTISHTGIAGLTLGGGLGWLMRRHGLTVDNLIGAELVTAEGEVVEVDGDRHPDLLWGLRGGGGNFGVVTSFTYRAHPVGPIVTGGLLVFPAERGVEALAGMRDVMATVSDDLTTFGVVLTAPPHAPFPPELQGRPVVALGVCHIGDPEAAAAELAPLRAMGPALDLVGPMPFTALQSMIDETAPHGRGNYQSGLQLADLPDEAARRAIAAVSAAPSPFSHILFPAMGGAVARVAPDATAYPHRSSPYMAWVVTEWLLPDHANAREVNRSWVRATRESLGPFGHGVYVNALGDEPDRLGEAYGPNLPRLRELKRRWDPTNVFRLNVNIDPDL
jgi:FAD/FMN-containing dehydrogenase